ncbi:hypothetical protein IFO70_12470 [Phormidium tenue FACHB-886]|nr:hypothetical protein [Phormidium tenue FACHB-886]
MLSSKTFRTSVKENSLAVSSRLSFSTRRSEFGDEIDDAEDLGTLRSGNSRSFSGDVGGRDLDFFKFRLDKRNRFTARLENDGNDAIAVTVLDRRGRGVRGSNGRLLFTNVEAGETFSLNDPQLKSGSYFLRVQSEEGRNEDYELRLSVGSGSSSGGGSVDLDDARDLGSLSLGQSRSGGGTIGSDDTDLYKFDISGTSRMNFRLTNNSLSDPIALSVLDDSGNAVRKNNGGFLFVNVNQGNTGSLVAPTLRSGTYYLRFTSQEGDSESYSFRVTRSASTSPV